MADSFYPLFPRLKIDFGLENREDLEKYFVFVELENVMTFLIQQPTWVRALHEVRRKIETYFPLAVLSLRISSDPTDVQLFVTIDPRCEPLQAVATKRRFDSDWWYNFSRYLGGRLSIMLDREKTKVNGGGWDVIETTIGAYADSEDASVEQENSSPKTSEKIKEKEIKQTAHKYYTPAEYLALEDAAEFRSEYFKGQLYQMAGGTLNHNRIARNLSNLLTQALGNGNCEVFIGDVKLLVAENGLYTYPDLLVICGEPEFAEGRNDTITNPMVIIEVLSGSTRAYDLTDKFDLYKSIETFQHYILIEQDRSYIHYFQKSNDNKWTIQTIRGLDNNLAIPELGLELSFQQIYERVQFPPIVSSNPQVI